MEVLLIAAQKFLVGTGVGVMSAALGVGGGVLMVPAFMWFLADMDINTAKGSSLFVITMVAAFNTWRMHRGDMRSPRDIIVLLSVGSVIGSFLASLATSRMPDTVVTWIFIGLLVFAGMRSFLLAPRVVPEGEVRKRRSLSILVGFVTGIAAGSTGTGGGAILVPFALWMGIVSNERVVALSNAVMISTCAAGTLGHFLSEPTAVGMTWTYGMVNVSLAPLVFLGAVAAAPVGRALNRRLSLKRRRLVMGFMLVSIAVKLAYPLLT